MEKFNRPENKKKNENSISPEVILPELKMWFPIPEPGQVNYEARIRPERIKIPEEVIESLKNFIRTTIEKISGYSKPHPDGIIIGLSGDIDSTTTTVLCKEALLGTDKFVKGIIFGRAPEGKKGDMNDLEYEDIVFAIKSAKDIGVDYQYLDISSIVNFAYQMFPHSSMWELSGILPRLRAALLYQLADSHNAICAGTTNGTEFILGAFTFGGPAGHFQPFLDFYKSEVYKIAEMLGVPDYIIKRRPAISELGVYDEKLYGASCYILDPILRRLNYQRRSPESVAKELGHDVHWLYKIKKLRIMGEQGRKYPPVFIVGREYKIKIRPQVKFDRDSYFDNLI